MMIRRAVIEDAEMICSLSKELGYTPSVDEIIEKQEMFEINKNDVVFVAILDNVVGWIHASLVDPIESESFVEIRGLVVHGNFRRQGIGSLLIMEVEKWAKNRGYHKLRVRTNIKRDETRNYYINRNFISIKTQEVFERII